MGGPMENDLMKDVWMILGVIVAPHIENKFNYKVVIFVDMIYLSMILFYSTYIAYGKLIAFLTQ